MSLVTGSLLWDLPACLPCECSLPCPLNTTWPLVHQHLLFDSRALSDEKQSHRMTKKTNKKTVNESDSRLTEAVISFFCPFAWALSRVSAGQSLHSATFYLLTSKHLIIRSAHRLGGQLTSVNTQVNQQLIGHPFTLLCHSKCDGHWGLRCWMIKATLLFFRTHFGNNSCR